MADFQRDGGRRPAGRLAVVSGGIVRAILRAAAAHRVVVADLELARDEAVAREREASVDAHAVLVHAPDEHDERERHRQRDGPACVRQRHSHSKYSHGEYGHSKCGHGKESHSKDSHGERDEPDRTA